MQGTNEYVFSRIAHEEISQFQIFVGSKDFVDQQINDIQSQLPQQYNLFQNFPNPFNSSTYIQFQIPSYQKVSLKIYDLMGREVITLVNEIRPAGSFQICWDGKDNHGNEVGSGVYVCAFRGGEYFRSQKIIMLK